MGYEFRSSCIKPTFYKYLLIYMLTIIGTIAPYNMAYAIPINDFCELGEELIVDGACNMVDNIGASASNHPTDIMACGDRYLNPLDVWFFAEVPASGKLTVETNNFDGWGFIMEAYTGDCTNLNLIACSYYKDRANNDYNARIELEGLDPFSIINFRVVQPNGAELNFEICAKDQGYSVPCKIDLIELGEQTTCDPITNSFSQELILHYRTDGTPNMVRVEDRNFQLSSSPDTVILENLPARGWSRSIQAELHQDYAVNDCRDNSYYFATQLIAEPQNCFGGVVQNDECDGAILLPVGNNCSAYIGNNIGATETSDPPRNYCYFAGNVALDVWMKFIVPPSGNAIISLESINEGIVPVYKVYEGGCSNEIACAFYNESIRVENKTPGDTIFIQIADNGNRQGEFGICIIEAQPFINDSCHQAINIPVVESCDTLIYSIHGGANSSMPTARLSCGNQYQDDNDMWFKLVSPDNGQMEVEIEQMENGYIDYAVSFYRGGCAGALTELTCFLSNSKYRSQTLSDLGVGEEVLVRIISKTNKSSFRICAKPIVVPNDICNDAILLPVDGSCETFIHKNASASNYPTPKLACGNGNMNDLWFKAVVPASGNISVSLGAYDRVDVQLYTGTCSDLTPYFCDSDYFDRLPMSAEGLAPGSTIYIRVVNAFDEENSFQLCISEEYFNDCRIELITLGAQSACDPLTNTFTQEFTIHYNNPADELRLEIGSLHFIELTDSPQTFSIERPSSGGTVDLHASIYYFNNNCNQNSPYILSDAMDIPNNCYQDAVINDQCFNPTLLEVSDTCTYFVGNNLGATFDPEIYTNCPHIGDFPLRVWYEVIVPITGRIAINVYDIGSMEPVFHVFDGPCDNLNLLTSCGGVSYNSAYFDELAPGDTLTISVTGTRGLLQGEFGICVIEPPLLTNDICETAINIDYVDCGEFIYTNYSATASDYPQQGLGCGPSANNDVWFTATVPESGNFTFETTEALRGNTDIDYEIFTGTCTNLNFLDCKNSSAYPYYLNDEHIRTTIYNQNPGDILYFRVSSLYESAFGVCITELPPFPNDICNDAIALPVDGSCQTFDITGVSASNHPTANLYCDNTSPAKDSWFKIHIPEDGSLTVQTDQVSGGLTDMVMEIYEGNCTNLIRKDCDDEGGNNSHAKIDMTGLEQGDSLFVRVSNYGNNNQGEYQMCASFMQNPCGIDSINYVSQSVCDPETNSFNQTIDIYYRADGSVDELYVDYASESLTYILTSSPKRIVISDLPANGNRIPIDYELRSAGSTNSCSNMSELSDTLLMAGNCFSGVVENDDCLGAINLPVQSICDFQYYDLTGATMSTAEGLGNNFNCSTPGILRTQDVWFKVEIPTSTSIKLNRTGMYLVADLYKGTCESLEFVDCGIEEFSGDAGEIYYLRMYDRSSDRQAPYGLCLQSLCPDEELIEDTLSTSIRYEDHIKIMANNVVHSTGDVVYDAGQCIELQAGFEVTQGALFEAVIDGCYNQNPECPIQTEDFVGAYKVSYEGDASGGWGIPFDTIQSVLFSSIPLNSEFRRVALNHLPAFGGFPIIVELDFLCGEVQMRLKDTGSGCASSIFINGAHVDGFNLISTYDQNDDSEIVINIIDYYENGDCGFNQMIKTVKFTKVQ